MSDTPGRTIKQPPKPRPETLGGTPDRYLTDEQIADLPGGVIYHKGYFPTARQVADAAADHAWAARDEEVAELERRLELPVTVHGDYVLRAEAIEAASGLVALCRRFQGSEVGQVREAWEIALGTWNEWVQNE